MGQLCPPVHSLHHRDVVVVSEAGRARHQRMAGRTAAGSGLQLDYILGYVSKVEYSGGRKLKL